MPSAGSPGVHDDLSHDKATLAVIVFVAPQVFAMVAEGPIVVWLDRVSRSRSIAAGLVVMAAAILACGLAPSALVFAIAYSIYGVGSGVACSFAQIALIEERPDEHERAMLRWTLAGVLGDLLAPLLLWGASRVVGWRGAFVLAAVLLVISAASCSGMRVVRPDATSDAPEEEEPSMWTALRTTLGVPGLKAWLFAAALAGLMDETLAAFGALLVRDRAGGDGETEVTLAILSLSLGAAAGVLVVERWVARVPPLRLLLGACGLCASAFVLWLAVDWFPLGLASLFVVGAAVSPMYPIIKSQAYRAAKGREAHVNALSQLFAPVDFLAPLAVGMIADRWGLVAALGALLVQPVLTGAIAISMAGNGGAATDTDIRTETEDEHGTEKETET